MLRCRAPLMSRRALREVAGLRTIPIACLFLARGARSRLRFVTRITFMFQHRDAKGGRLYIHSIQTPAMALVGTSTTHNRAAPSPPHMDRLAFNAQTQMRGDVPGREGVRQHRRDSRCFTSGRCGATCTDYCRVPLDNTGSMPGGERRGGVTLGCVRWMVLGVGCCYSLWSVVRDWASPHLTGGSI